MDIREKLVELFYDNNVRCDQKIEGLADDVMDIIAHSVTGQEDCKDCAEATQNCIVKLQEQIAELCSALEALPEEDYYILRNIETGMYFRGKGINR